MTTAAIALCQRSRPSLITGWTKPRMADEPSGKAKSQSPLTVKACHCLLYISTTPVTIAMMPNSCERRRYSPSSMIASSTANTGANPPTSRQINALEATLGVPLFDRIGRRLKLTSEGEALLRLSRSLLGEVQTFHERAAALKKGETGVLRVAATPQVIENTLANFLGGYRRRYPGVEVQLVEEGGVAMPRRLEFGDVHFALMALDDDRFWARLLYPVRGVAVVPKEHRLSR